MKRFGVLCLAFILVVSLIAGCTPKTKNTEENTVQSTQDLNKTSKKKEDNPTSEETVTEEKTTTQDVIPVKILMLKGPTSMGIVHFMAKSKSLPIDGYDFQFSIASNIDEVAPALIKKEIDIAALPSNMASVLYNKTEGDIVVLAINTLGVLYILENGENIKEFEDLKGKTIVASGKGATPEFVLNYLLQSNGIDPNEDVTIEWKTEHAECLASLIKQEQVIAMLPQPFVTTAQMKKQTLHIALDLTEQWRVLQKNTENKSSLITGVVVARKEFIEENPEAIKSFMNHYEQSVSFVNSNIEEAAKWIGEYNIVPTEVAIKAIPYCNITFIKGDAMKEQLSGYFKVLEAQNPKSIGGKLPEEDFYYSE